MLGGLVIKLAYILYYFSNDQNITKKNRIVLKSIILKRHFSKQTLDKHLHTSNNLTEP